ncbi:MAG: PD-(D/E)XK nuclease family protein [Thermoplasmata archaeon]|nr:PD-(D/E)XK nuclease family protein [Thermoplasmata archaeon]
MAAVTPPDLLPWILALVGLGLVGAGAWALARSLASRWSGALLSADDGRTAPENLVSETHRLVGRPDEIWRRRDGAVVPVELKSRAAPDSGVLPSHRVQVEAYCLLLESTTGRSPPYGVVVYAGGVRRTVPWNARALGEVDRLLAEVRSEYDGRATPTPGKCRNCRWRNGCDVRAG